MVFVDYDPKTAGDLWRLPLTGDRSPVLVAGGPENQVHPQISPDGRWLAFSGPRLGSPRNIWVQGYLRSDAFWEVVRGADDGIRAQPRWRSDGRELFWVFQQAGIGGSLWSVAVESSDTALSFGPSAKLFDISLWNLPHGSTNFNNYDVSADGQRFLYVRSATPESDGQRALTVVVNWPELLRD